MLTSPSSRWSRLWIYRALEVANRSSRKAPKQGRNWRRATWSILLLSSFGLLGCGEQGFFPTTVERGPDFSIAEVVFDAGFYYCKVEPMLVERRCGSGDPGLGDAAGGCHTNVTSYRLVEYAPLVAESCAGGINPSVSPSTLAQQNYQASQIKMRRSPDAAPLLTRPTGKAQHPRMVFDAQSAEAELIRTWATQYSTQ